MIRVGTSGWSYPEWVGPFYPVQLRSSPGEWLEHYATRFPTVEINSTFYAFPSDEILESWMRRGVVIQERSPFEFSLKLPREVTHLALVEGDLARARAITGRFDREVLDPLAGEGLLGAVLVQLSPRYAASPEAVAGVEAVLEALVERNVAIEPRHPSWAYNGCVAPVAETLFRRPEVCLAELDIPSVPPIRPPTRSHHAYLRFHGRRAEYWSGEKSQAELRDGARYDYLYSREELAPWVERVREHAAAGTQVRVYFNNTPHAKGVLNALEFMEGLGLAPHVPKPRLTEQTRLEL